MISRNAAIVVAVLILNSVCLASAADTGFPFDTVTGSCRLLWVATGDSGFSGMGSPVAIHDANADGVLDLVVTGWREGSGETLFRVLSGATGETLHSYALSGRPFIAGTADFNKDGRIDLLLSSYFPKVSGDPPSAEPGFYRVSAASSANGIALWSRASAKSQPTFGMAVQEVADLNGDNTSDVLATGMKDEFHPELYALSGRTGKILRRYTPPAGASSYFGAGMAAADLDADTSPDLVLSDILFGPTPTTIEARVWAISGATKEILWSRKDFSDTLLGDTILAVPDLNADGVQDVIVAAPNDRAYVRGTVQALSGADGRRIWVVPGKVVSEQFGRGLTVMQDIDGDGVPEIAAGAPAFLPPYLVGGLPGHFQVISGRSGRIITYVKEILPSAGMAFSSQFGMQLASPGDLDGDGLADLVVSAPRYNPENGTTLPGAVIAFTLR